MAKLVILNQGMTGRPFELNVERTTVGRVEDNTFQITDPSVSSHHAEILMRGTEILVRDLNSTNGTYVNNERITEMELKPNDRIRGGQTVLVFELEKPKGVATVIGEMAAGGKGYKTLLGEISKEAK
jgi:pSer/pThr/pTyr-binding forkhead associated (FHA) protein